MTTFLFDLPDEGPSSIQPAGCFYGFPQIDGLGVKVAEHSGGTVVEDPSQVDRRLDPADQRRVTDFCRTHLPQVSGRLIQHSVCLYTMTSDGHFVVDRHPDHPQVVRLLGYRVMGSNSCPCWGKSWPIWRSTAALRCRSTFYLVDDRH